MPVRSSCPALSKISSAVLAVVCLAAFLFGSAALASAADDPNTPWIVTRKADNRVLPKQDSVTDIQKGLATPGKTMGDQAAAEVPAQAKKPVPPKAEAANAKPVPQTEASAVSGQASVPKITVEKTQIVILLPTSAMVTDTRYLNLDSPRRVALDVMGAWTYSGKKKFNLNKGVLEKAEIGVHTDFLRLVLHLTRGKVPGEIVPSFKLVEGGLQITVPLAK